MIEVSEYAFVYIIGIFIFVPWWSLWIIRDKVFKQRVDYGLPLFTTIFTYLALTLAIGLDYLVCSIFVIVE